MSPMLQALGIDQLSIPERIRLDEWGYPIVHETDVPASLQAHARRAVAACPTLALMLEQVPAPTALASGPSRR